MEGRAAYDNQVGRLQAGRHLVKIGKAGGNAGERIIQLKQLVDAVNCTTEQAAYAAKTPLSTLAAFGNLEYPLLGMLQQFA